MFKNRFIKLCNTKGVAPTAVCQAIGLTSSAFSNWNDQSMPRAATLQKFADYFGITVEELLGSDEPTLPAKEEPPTAAMGNEGYDRMSRLLKAFGQLSPDDQEFILRLAEKTSRGQ